MSYMIIDIGSNTVKYSIFDGTPTRAAHRSETVGFIHYISDGVVSEAGLSALCETLGRFLADAEKMQIPQNNRLAFATASFRRLRDPAAVIDEVKRRVGLSVELISGEEEAILSLRGMLSLADPTPEKGILLDMGGGSTETTLFEGGKRLFCHSNPFGSLSLRERFVQGEYPTPTEADAIRRFVGRTVLPPDAPAAASDGRVHCYMVGGSAKAIGTLLAVRQGRAFSPDGVPVPVEDYRVQLADYIAGNDLAEMKKRYPDRYRVLIPGLVACDEIWRAVDAAVIHISDGGMREGYFLSRVAGR